MPRLRVVMAGDFGQKIAASIGVVRNNKRSCVMPAAELVKERWVARAPYDNVHHKAGEQHYRDSIELTVESETEYGVVIRVASPKWYGDLLEFGTSRMGAEPSLRPALDGSVHDAPQLIGEALQAVLRK